VTFAVRAERRADRESVRRVLAAAFGRDDPACATPAWLGHASAMMTCDLYSHLYDDDLDSVAERLDTARTVRVRP
jgi:hypothetical protein